MKRGARAFERGGCSKNILSFTQILLTHYFDFFAFNSEVYYLTSNQKIYLFFDTQVINHT